MGDLEQKPSGLVPTQKDKTASKVNLAEDGRIIGFFILMLVMGLVFAHDRKDQNSSLNLPIQPTSAFSLEAIKAELSKENISIDLDFQWFNQSDKKLRMNKVEGGQFDWNSLSDWSSDLVETYKQLGLSNGNFDSIEVVRRQLSQLELGRTCDISPHTLELDYMISSSDLIIATLAHEMAHIEAGHCFFLPSHAFSGHSEFAIALYANQHTESQAEIFSIEALAYIYYHNDNESIRELAKKALRWKLNTIVSGAASLTISLDSDIDDPSFKDTYFYDYLPGVILNKLANNPNTTFPTLLPAKDFAVQEISLPNTARMLQELGLTN